MTLRVGEFYTGELAGFATSHAASVHALSAGKDEDLGAKVPADSVLPALRLSFAQPGSHVLAYESHPSQVTLAPDKFHAYLHDEGMDWVVRQREKDAAAFFEGKGVSVTTPDVAAFRDQVQKKFLESDFAKNWPSGMLDRINKAGA